jgi:mycothiol synthase
MTSDLIPATDDRAQGIVDLVNRANVADDIPLAMVHAEMIDLLHGPHMDPARDSRIVLDGDTVIGYLLAHYRPSGEEQEKIFFQGVVDPAYRRQGIGTALLRWGVERSEQRFAGVANDLPRVIRVDSYEWQSDQIALHAAFGFVGVRYFHEMIRPLADLPTRNEPEGIVIRRWRPDDGEAARLTHNDAFRDHWGSIPADPATWHQWLTDYGTRLDLSFVAYAGAELVGCAINAHYPHDRDLHGRLEGWIESLATARSHRNRGIASALITASIGAFAAAGFDHAALGVDTESPTGANRLYDRLGFTTLRRTVVSQRKVE